MKRLFTPPLIVNRQFIIKNNEKLLFLIKYQTSYHTIYNLQLKIRNHLSLFIRTAQSTDFAKVLRKYCLFLSLFITFRADFFHRYNIQTCFRL